MLAVIGVCGVKGAPGASTVALLTAAFWPQPAVLVEADPAGGEWALVLEGPQGQVLPAKPSIAELAVDAVKRVPSGEQVWASAMQTSCGVAVVCGMPAAQPMTQLLREYGRHVGSMLEAEPKVVIDAGRLTPDTPSLALLAASTVVVVVVPDRHEAFWRLTDLLPGLLSVMTVEEDVRSVVVPVVVADARRGQAAAREVDELLGQRHIPARQARWLPRDEKVAAAVRAGGTARVTRSALVRSARSLTEQLARQQDVVREQRAHHARLAAASQTDAAAQWRGAGWARGA